MERGLRAPLKHISQAHLNHEFAPHKMTIGQLAVHCMAWAEYFMADDNNKPWTPVEWTCIPCDYPLKIEFVNQIITNGVNSMKAKLQSINDHQLEITETGEKGPGYILCRLQLHTLTHSNQMAYLRQLLEPDWDFGSHFGDMATAYIRLEYFTDRDLRIPGF